MLIESMTSKHIIYHLPFFFCPLFLLVVVVVDGALKIDVIIASVTPLVLVELPTLIKLGVAITLGVVVDVLVAAALN